MFNNYQYTLDLDHCIFDVIDWGGRCLGTICSPGRKRAIEYAKELFGSEVFAVIKSYKEITC